MTATIGIDAGEKLQEFVVLDERGNVLASGRFDLTSDGLARFVAATEPYRSPLAGELPHIVIETGRGALVATLQSLGYVVHPVNPLKAKRAKELYGVAGAKDDRTDARSLAEMLRLSPDRYPPMPIYSDAQQRLTIAERAHQDTLWLAMKQGQRCRSMLQETWPGVFTKVKPAALLKPDLPAVLRAYPTAAAAAGATAEGVREALFAGGRQRLSDKTVDKWLTVITAPTITMPTGVADALAADLIARLDIIGALLAVEKGQRKHAVAMLQAHPLYPLIESVPGLGGITAARVLGEIGDDPGRFAHAGNIRAFAGTAPVTRSSSQSSSVKRRQVANNRLNHATFLWAFSGLTNSAGVKAAYDRRRNGVTASGRPLADKHAAALRNVGNHLIGCLWSCIANGTLWSEQKAWGHLFPDLDLTGRPAGRPASGDDELDVIADAEEAMAGTDAPDGA